METLIEKFGRYIVDKNTPHVDYVFKFENNYGALLVIERFENVDYYSVATTRYDNEGNLALVIIIPWRSIRAILCRPIEEVCEYLQSIKDLK